MHVRDYVAFEVLMVVRSDVGPRDYSLCERPHSCRSQPSGKVPQVVQMTVRDFVAFEVVEVV